jgi:hypothetical protein
MLLLQVTYRGCTTGTQFESLGGKSGVTSLNGQAISLCTTDL